MVFHFFRKRILQDLSLLLYYRGYVFVYNLKYVTVDFTIPLVIYVILSMIIIWLLYRPSRLGLQNIPTKPLQRRKTTPASILMWNAVYLFISLTPRSTLAWSGSP